MTNQLATVDKQLPAKAQAAALAKVQKERDVAVAAVVLNGDLSKLNARQKVQFYISKCQAMGLNWRSMPYKYLKMNGVEVLYLGKEGGAQLNKKHKVSHQIISEETILEPEGPIYRVRVRAFDATGRSEEASAEVALVKENGQWIESPKKHGGTYKYWQGDGTYSPLPLSERLNARMKAESKAKLRATKDLCGEGGLDESDVETLPGAELIDGPAPSEQDEIVDQESGETVDGEVSEVSDLSQDQIEEIAEGVANPPLSEKLETIAEQAQAAGDTKNAEKIKQMAETADKIKGQHVAQLIGAYSNKGWAPEQFFAHLEGLPYGLTRSNWKTTMSLTQFDELLRFFSNVKPAEH